MNLDLHVQSVVSSRLDDPGPREARSIRAPSTTDPSEVDAAPANLPGTLNSSVTPPHGERCCPSHSPTLRPWIDETESRKLAVPPSYVEEYWSPALLCRPKNRRLKPKHYLSL